VNVDDHPEPLVGEGESENASPGEPVASSELALQTRRMTLPAVAIGVIGLVVATVIGYPLGGVGICLGLAFGMLNARLLQNAVERRFVVLAGGTNRRTHFLSSGATHLAGITVVTLLLVWLVRPLGFGTLIGLAVFQITMIGFSAAAMYRQLRA
jgi:hypothetical protein